MRSEQEVTKELNEANIRIQYLEDDLDEATTEREELVKELSFIEGEGKSGNSIPEFLIRHYQKYKDKFWSKPVCRSC